MPTVTITGNFDDPVMQKVLTCLEGKLPVSEKKPDKAPKEEPKEEVTDEEESVDAAGIRAHLSALVKSGKRAEVNKLLLSFGCTRLSDIEEEKLPALLAAARGLA